MPSLKHFILSAALLASLLLAAEAKESCEYSQSATDISDPSGRTAALLQKSYTQIGLSQASHADLLREGLVSPRVKQCAFKLAKDAVAPKLKNLNWLHVPKTGTSFIATLWNYACGQHDPPLDLYVDPYHALMCAECYDFALMERYPKSKYCLPGVLSDTFQTQHRPTSKEAMTAGQNYVTILRRPSQRIISAYHANHASGFSPDTMQDLRYECAGKGAACFARFPGIAGCMTRMLTGGNCADGEAPEGDAMSPDLERRVDEAVDAIQSLSFVGLTEEWDESICLFHVMFGGRMSEAELKDIHLSRSSHHDYDESELAGFVDEADEIVYAAAKDRYRELRQKHLGEKGQSGSRSACEHLASQSISSAPLSASSEGTQCSCKAAGMECGKMTDVDCGDCPRKRMTDRGFVGSYELQCSSEGKCLVNGEQQSFFAWHPTF